MFTACYTTFEFPDMLVDMIMDNSNTCPEVHYRELLPNPFMILYCLSRKETNEGREFWAALLAKYKEEEHCPDEVTEIDILILKSRHCR